MPVPRYFSSVAPPRPAGVLALASGLAWYASLMRPLWAARTLGPICGHASAIGPHCPPCFAALALAVLGLGLTAITPHQLKPAASRGR